MKRTIKSLFCAGIIAFTAPGMAANYQIDVKGAHASIEFKIKHLGYSWLTGRFNKFDGSFEYDNKTPEKASISVNIDVTSIDSNHAVRDKHLRSDKYLNVEKHPAASFKSTKISLPNGTNGTMTGELTLNGVTKSITMDIEKVGEGKDPWGGYRTGFTGTTTIKLEDFGYTFNLGPASKTVDLTLNIEGIRQ